TTSNYIQFIDSTPIPIGHAVLNRTLQSSAQPHMARGRIGHVQAPPSNQELHEPRGTVHVPVRQGRLRRPAVAQPSPVYASPRVGPAAPRNAPAVGRDE